MVLNVCWNSTIQTPSCDPQLFNRALFTHKHFLRVDYECAEKREAALFHLCFHDDGQTHQQTNAKVNDIRLVDLIDKRIPEKAELPWGFVCQ